LEEADVLFCSSSSSLLIFSGVKLPLSQKNTDEESSGYGDCRMMARWVQMKGHSATSLCFGVGPACRISTRAWLHVKERERGLLLVVAVIVEYNKGSHLLYYLSFYV
jgi:hypothetical protein